jgi:PAS domain S-box-containing protein
MQPDTRRRIDDVTRAARATAAKLDETSVSLAEFVRALRGRREILRSRAANELIPTPEMIWEALGELQASEEELAIAGEEMRLQNEMIVATRHEMDLEIARYRDYFRSCPDAYVVTDGHGVIREANAAAARLLGVSLQHVDGKILSAFIVRTDAEAFRTALTGLGPVAEEKLRVSLRKRGHDEPLPVKMRGAATRDANGAILEARWTIREVIEPDAADRAAAEIARLEDEMRELRATMARQAKLIEELTQRESAAMEAAAAAEPSTASLNDMADLRGLRVLIVDGDDDARELLAAVLAECGARVWHTADTDEAIAIVERERPDVLVGDVGPRGGGCELIREVRALGADRGGAIAAVALTGYVSIEESRNALRAGYQVHVSKPIDTSLLTHAVANVAGVPIVDFMR